MSVLNSLKKKAKERKPSVVENGCIQDVLKKIGWIWHWHSNKGGLTYYREQMDSSEQAKSLVFWR